MDGNWEDREGIRAWGTGRAGKSSRKPRRPRPYSRALAGISLRSKYVHCPRPWRPANFITTRHAASLRPPRNGRIGLNRRIPKGGTLQEARMGSIFIGGFFLLARKSVSIMQSHFSKTVAMRRAASLWGQKTASLLIGESAIAISVGAVPSVASARPNSAASVIKTVALHVVVWYAHGGGNGDIGIAMRHATPSPQTPTVGAGSSQREDSPAHPMRIPRGHQRERRRRITTRHAASLRSSRNGIA